MSNVNLRAVLIALLFANLAFAAWAFLIDQPVQAPAARDISHLLPLTLSSEPAPVSSAASSAPAAAAVAAVAPVADIPAGPRCVTVGPFSDMVVAAAADAALQARGFSSKQRNEPKGGTRCSTGCIWTGCPRMPRLPMSCRNYAAVESPMPCDARTEFS